MCEKERKYAFYSHKECEFFPCHKGIAEEDFNCLFCYCPLYLTGTGCGGNYVILPNGVKDCSGCTFPHRKENYDKMLERIRVCGEQQRAAENESSPFAD